MLLDEEAVLGLEVCSAASYFPALGSPADVIMLLARSPNLRRPDHRRILDGIARKLETGVVYTHREDERLAAVVMSLVGPPIWTPTRSTPCPRSERTAPRRRLSPDF